MSNNLNNFVVVVVDMMHNHCWGLSSLVGCHQPIPNYVIRQKQLNLLMSSSIELVAIVLIDINVLSRQ